MAQRIRKRLRRPSWRILIIATALVLVVGGGTAFALTRGDDTQATEATVTTATASLSTIERTVTASGTLTPTATADESFTAAGTVEEVYVEEGDTVTEGQKLAKIDTLALTQARLEAKVNYLSAKADYSDAQDAADSTDLSDARVSAAKTALKVAKQAYADAQDAMSDRYLRASVAGLVTSVGIEVGDVAGSSSGSGSASSGSASAGGGAGMGTTTTTTTTTAGTISIVGTEAWQVSTTVSGDDIDNVTTGLQVEMTSDDLADTVYGIVSAVGKLPDTSSGTIAYPVTVDITGDTSALYDGVSVDLSIIYERRTNVLTVPSAAVTTADGASTVDLVGTDGTVTATTVEVGQSSGNQVEITSGVAEGDTVSYEPFQAMGGGSGSTEQDVQMPDFANFGGGGGGQGGPPSGGMGGFPGGRQ